MASSPVFELATFMGGDAVDVLARLITESRAYGAVVVNAEDRKQIVAFGVSYFVTDDAAAEIVSGRRGCVICSLFDEAFVAGCIPDPNAQLAAQHAQGLNLVACVSGWVDERDEIKEALRQSLRIDSFGLNIRSLYKQVHSTHQASQYKDRYTLPVVQRLHLELPNGYPCPEPILIGMTREEWLRSRKLNDSSNEIFGATPPRIKFSAKERQVLQLLDLYPQKTLKEISARMKFGDPKRLYETMREALDKVTTVTGKARQRGHGRERRLLEEHIDLYPEDIRPWVTLPEQVYLRL